VVQVREALLVLLVGEHRMALREGAALHVLAGEAHPVAFEQERTEGERLAGGPIEALAGSSIFLRLSRKRWIVRWTLKPSGTAVILEPISCRRSTVTPVWPRRGSSTSSRTALRPAQRPSSQSALLGL
jgi:hypothetical protein